MAERSPSRQEENSKMANLKKWSDKFMDFLKDSNYLGSATSLKKHNLSNIFNLLFVPQTRNDPTLNDLSPPHFETLFQHMQEQDIVSSDSEGSLKFILTA